VGLGDVDAVDPALQLDHVVATGRQVADEVCADEAPSTSDERSHGGPLYDKAPKP